MGQVQQAPLLFLDAQGFRTVNKPHMEFILLRRNGSLSVGTSFMLPKGFTWCWWQVTPGTLRPPGRSIQLRDYMSWLIYLTYGERKAYRALLVRDEQGRLAHLSMVFPRDFKESFMEEGDLQICRTYTEPEYRGKGLAKFGVQEILRSGLVASGYYWYVVAPTNTTSIQVAKASGFQEYGLGHKSSPLGISKLGRIVAQKHHESNMSGLHLR